MTTVAFKANKNNTNQTSVVASTFTQVTFGTEVYDNGNYFAANAWTPPAGYVSLVLNLGCGGTISNGTSVFSLIYKNGSAATSYFQYASNNAALLSMEFNDTCNGSDVYTAQGFIAAGSGLLFTGANEFTCFSGVWLSA